MGRVIRKLSIDGERWLLLWLYTFVVLVIFIEVIRRYVFDFSSLWGEEAARYSFIYLVWIGAAVAIRDRTHIRIDVLTHYLPERGVALVYLFGDLVTAALAVFALYWSIQPVLTSVEYGSVTDGLRVVKAWFLISVPFGFSLVLLRVGQSMWRDCRNLLAGRPVFTGERLFED